MKFFQCCQKYKKDGWFTRKKEFNLKWYTEIIKLWLSRSLVRKITFYRVICAAGAIECSSKDMWSPVSRSSDVSTNWRVDEVRSRLSVSVVDVTFSTKIWYMGRPGDVVDQVTFRLSDGSTKWRVDQVTFRRSDAVDEVTFSTKWRYTG